MKKYLQTIVVLCLALCGLTAKAQINLGTRVEPLAGQDYQIVNAYHVRGGHHQVTTNDERNAITSARREWGMFCTVASGTEATTYQLVNWQNNNDKNNNTNWQEFSGAGGGGNLNQILTANNDAGTNRITNLGVPLSPNDAATMQYVLDQVGGGGDMKKATYDSSGTDGVVDNAEKVNNLTVQTAVPSGAVFTDSQNASQVEVTMAGGITHTDVQAALEELQAEINGKLGNTLAEANIFVGSSTSTATAVPITGDLTLSSNGSLTIDPGVVDTDKLADDAVTLAKLDQMGAADGQILKWNQTNTTWEVVDAAAITATIYWGTLSEYNAAVTPGTITGLAESDTCAEPNIEWTSTAGEYFTVAVPASWRKPLLKIDEYETLSMLEPTNEVDVNGTNYTVWQINIILENGLDVDVE